MQMQTLVSPSSIVTRYSKIRRKQRPSNSRTLRSHSRRHCFYFCLKDICINAFEVSQKSVVMLFPTKRSIQVLPNSFLAEAFPKNISLYDSSANVLRNNERL